jgi:hypothetical protein
MSRFSKFAAAAAITANAVGCGPLNRGEVVWECDAQRPCPNGDVCIDGTCHATCVDASDCVATEICLDGVCLDPSDPDSNDGTRPPGFIDGHAIIPATTEAPLIDGIADLAWWYSAAHAAEHILLGNISGEDDLSGNWRALWSESYLFLLVQIQDDSLRADSEDNYQDDSVELYIDRDRSAGTTYDGVNDFQFSFRVADGRLKLGTNSAGSTEGIAFACSTADAAGYTCEASVPWTTLTGSPEAGNVLGFDVHFSDDDDGGDRDAKLAWHAQTDSSWTEPSVFGSAVLYDSETSTGDEDGGSGDEGGAGCEPPCEAGYHCSSWGECIPDCGVDCGQGERKQASLGMGLAFVVDWSTEYPFLDLMKQARRWQDWSAGGAEVTTVDSDDWVTSLESGQSAGTVFLTVSDDAPVVYSRFVVRWEGTGVISYSWSANKVGEAHGGDLIEVDSGPSLLQIESVDPNDPLRNISIVPETHVAAFDSGQIFNPDFLARMADFRAVRFMNWMVTNNSEQADWIDRPKPTHRTWRAKGVPAEVMVALANQLNADPWFNMPHLSTADYQSHFAELVRDSLAPHLIAYVEHSNEVWNWIFGQSHYAEEAGIARWGTDGGDVVAPFMQWHGMRTAQMCDVWKNGVFAGQAERVHCVMGVHPGWKGLETYALDCSAWVAEGNDPCYQHGIGSIGITGYFNGCLHDSAYEELMRSWFTQVDQGLTKGFEQAYDGQHFDCSSTIVGNKIEYYAYFAAEAAKRGLVMTAYEGGQHITANGHDLQDDPDFIAFHIAMNRDARMKELYIDNFANWREQGGALYMNYEDVGVPSKHGSWGALEYLTQPTSPKWEAITEFNGVPCWWPDCDTVR